MQQVGCRSVHHCLSAGSPACDLQELCCGVLGFPAACRSLADDLCSVDEAKDVYPKLGEGTCTCCCVDSSPHVVSPCIWAALQPLACMHHLLPQHRAWGTSE